MGLKGCEGSMTVSTDNAVLSTVSRSVDTDGTAQYLDDRILELKWFSFSIPRLITCSHCFKYTVQYFMLVSHYCDCI